MKNSRKIRGLLVMLIAFCFLAEPVKADDRTALDGIYVEDISVGGMTEEQITQAVNDKIEQLKPSVINLSAGEQNAQVTAGDLGLSCANPEVAREAVTIGQEGNVLKRFLTQNRLKNGETVTFSLKYTVDGEAARQAVIRSSLHLSKICSARVRRSMATVRAAENRMSQSAQRRLTERWYSRARNFP